MNTTMIACRSEPARRTLSVREREVLALIAEGCSNEAIAERLFLSVKTIESGIRSVFHKLDLHDDAHTNRRVLAARWYLAHVGAA